MKKYRQLAVYGTLKKGYPLHNWFIGAEFIKDDIVKGELYKVSYPFLLDGDNDVHVEVYDVDEDTFDKIALMEESAGYETELATLESSDKAYIFRYPKKEDYFEKIDKF